ncbi:MAG: hypothetical protein ANABAC_1309 [Anaerolineae bacterium]|nr:MAG: hypothetical protein ANABAC_1309 [Anaerolineae bacterium]
MNSIVLIGLWILNGLLAILWLMVDNLILLACLPVLGWLVIIAPQEQRPWAGGAAGLGLAGAAVTPLPAAPLTLLIALTGMAGYYLERFNKRASVWTTIRGLALYGLVCLGYGIFRRWFLPSATADPMLSQGLGYLSAIASIALYILPLGFMALVAQSLFAHPPLQEAADDMIYRYRSRGKP